MAGTFDLDTGAIGFVVFIGKSSDRGLTEDLSMRVTQTSTMDSTSDHLNAISVLRTGESGHLIGLIKPEDSQYIHTMPRTR